MTASRRFRQGVGLVGIAALAAALSGVGADRVRVPEEWLEGNSSAREQRFAGLKVGENPPPLKVSQWKNAESTTLAALKGKVVMLDFWATWCGPCIASIPHSNDLYERYRGDGLVIIGVCNSRGADKMAETVESKGINYPVAADDDGQTVAAYEVDGFPDYYFIDRAGKLRILDCKNAKVDDAIKLLLAEKVN